MLRVHGRALPLRGERLHIGRHPACDLVLQDATVSRHHAIVRRDGEQWVIEDAGSRHGTWVDGERIQFGASLRPGQRIRVGSIELLVAEEAPEGAGRARRATAQGLRAPRRARRLSAPPPAFGYGDASQVDAIVMSARRALEAGRPERLPELVRALRASTRGATAHAGTSPAALHALGAFALEQARLRGDVEWLDAWLEALGASRQLPDLDQVRSLEGLVADGVRPSPEALRACLSRLEAASEGLTPHELRAFDLLRKLLEGPLDPLVRIPAQDD